MEIDEGGFSALRKRGTDAYWEGYGRFSLIVRDRNAPLAVRNRIFIAHFEGAGLVYRDTSSRLRRTIRPVQDALDSGGRARREKREHEAMTPVPDHMAEELGEYLASVTSATR